MAEQTREALRELSKPPKASEKAMYSSVREMPPMAVSSFDMAYNKTGSWRNVRPEIDYERCIFCLICWKFCPEPAIVLEEAVMPTGREKMRPVVDYDYCKGCGICRQECPVDAITSREEEK